MMRNQRKYSRSLFILSLLVTSTFMYGMGANKPTIQGVVPPPPLPKVVVTVNGERLNKISDTLKQDITQQEISQKNESERPAKRRKLTYPAPSIPKKSAPSIFDLDNDDNDDDDDDVLSARDAKPTPPKLTQNNPETAQILEAQKKHCISEIEREVHKATLRALTIDMEVIEILNADAYKLIKSLLTIWGSDETLYSRNLSSHYTPSIIAAVNQRYQLPDNVSKLIATCTQEHIAEYMRYWEKEKTRTLPRAIARSITAQRPSANYFAKKALQEYLQKANYVPSAKERRREIYSWERLKHIL